MTTVHLIELWYDAAGARSQALRCGARLIHRQVKVTTNPAAVTCAGCIKLCSAVAQRTCDECGLAHPWDTACVDELRAEAEIA